MCGITCIYSYNSVVSQPTDANELSLICDSMQKRGPDGEGQWFSSDKRVALGHRRLSIIDLSDLATQPMCSDNGNFVISFNGEIYNYAFLREKLIKKGYHFRSHSDTEVLLHLYAAKGRAMLHDLRGMYAFALWDNKRRGLFLARDPFGIKPLYYYDDGRTFKAASQVRALLAGGAIDTTPEPAGHVGFFLWGHIPEPFTLYRKIRSLPAGTCLWVDASGVEEPETVTDINDALFTNAGATLHDCPQQEQLRQVLLDSVCHHLIADVPVGLFLSAGLDSATLTALATEFENRIITVTLGFDEYEGSHNDETLLAKKIASHYGTQHYSIRINQNDFEQSLEFFFNAMDQPTIDGLNTFMVSHAASQCGLKVALSGLGGDELFGGYPSFSQIPRTVKLFKRLPQLSIPHKALHFISASILNRFTSPKYAGLFNYGADWSGAYLLRRGLYMPWELPDILDADMVREGWNTLKTMFLLERTVKKIKNEHLKVAALELNWYLRNQLLRDADWASMAHSLEIRVPFVDLPLLQTIAGMAYDHHSPTKHDMAQTPSKPLPDEIFRRSKTGFTVPIRKWLSDMSGVSCHERGLRGWAKMVYKTFYKTQ
ncbi:asparagine synthase (glutamine-hydrolyzing) [Desulfococcaceae bacterium HSG9]|nr:asparagine synthase (glutamine-hydrolyzing) [Desulfococcaceae bacterium HSG9]